MSLSHILVVPGPVTTTVIIAVAAHDQANVILMRVRVRGRYGYRAGAGVRERSAGAGEDVSTCAGAGGGLFLPAPPPAGNAVDRLTVDRSWTAVWFIGCHIIAASALACRCVAPYTINSRNAQQHRYHCAISIYTLAHV
jgi:hypothetical protein